MTEELRKNSLLSHIVMTGITNALAKEIGDDKERQTEDGVILDLDFKVNGHDIDIQEFCDHWQSQVGGMIKEAAKELAKEKISTVIDKIYKIEEKVDNVLDGLLDDWEIEEKEVNYQLRLNEAIKTVFNELNALSPEDLNDAINKAAAMRPGRVEAIRRAFTID